MSALTVDHNFVADGDGYNINTGLITLTDAAEPSVL